MSNPLISLGAFNKATKEYVFPIFADKKSKYVCPECDKDLMLCKGTKRIPHFRHYTDKVNPCHHYISPSESQIHKDAKVLIKQLLEGKKKLTFKSCCKKCQKNTFTEIDQMTKHSKIELEYSFHYNGNRIADVAYLNDDEISYIFEICHTHVTDPENRPEPWFEIKADKFIQMVNSTETDSYEIPCIRDNICEECLEKDIQIKTNAKLEIYLKTDIEKYVRLKLGLHFFHHYKSVKKDILRIESELKKIGCNCDREEHEECEVCYKLLPELEYLSSWGRYEFGNDREIVSGCGAILDPNMNDDEHFIKTINIFKDLFKTYTIVLRESKYNLNYFIVLTQDFRKNDYWKDFREYDDWIMKKKWLISGHGGYQGYEGVELLVDAVADLMNLISQTKKEEQRELEELRKIDEEKQKLVKEKKTKIRDYLNAGIEKIIFDKRSEIIKRYEDEEFYRKKMIKDYLCVNVTKIIYEKRNKIIQEHKEEMK